MRIFWLDRAKAIQVIKARAEEYARGNRDVLKVVPFSSLAEGCVPCQAVMQIFLLGTSGQDFLSRIERPLDFFSGLGIGVEVFPCTQEEAEGNPWPGGKERTVLFEY